MRQRIRPCSSANDEEILAAAAGTEPAAADEGTIRAVMREVGVELDGGAPVPLTEGPG